MADLRGKETVAIVRSLSMEGRVPVRVSQLVSLFMPYPAFFHQVIVKREAFNHILFQQLSSPLTELYAPMCIDTVTHTDNHVESIHWNLSFNLTFIIGLNLCKK